MPSNVRAEVTMSLCAEPLQNTRLFAGADLSLTTALSLRVNPVLYLAGDLLLSKGKHTSPSIVQNLEFDFSNSYASLQETSVMNLS